MLYPMQVISSRESMIQYNCSSPDSLYAAVEASWCSTREDECHNRTASQSDLCLSRSAYLEKYLGPCRSPFFLLMCVTYLIIFVVGVLGNSLTCIVIARHRVMRTITNYYLFSLAISDLLVLLLGLRWSFMNSGATILFCLVSLAATSKPACSRRSALHLCSTWPPWASNATERWCILYRPNTWRRTLTPSALSSCSGPSRCCVPCPIPVCMAWRR